MSSAIVNAETERLYAALGQQLVDLLPEGFERALAYAECEAGAAGCDVFFQQDGQVRFTFGSDALTDDFHALWQSMQADGQAPWHAAVFCLDGRSGRFQLHHVYAEQFDASLDTSERREPHLQGYFGDLPIDYSPV